MGNAYSGDVMMTLRDGPNPTSLNRATKLLANGSVSSVAISRDIIIHIEDPMVPTTYTVVFRGIECGRIASGVFEPSFSDNPLTGRVIRQLEGAL